MACCFNSRGVKRGRGGQDKDSEDSGVVEAHGGHEPLTGARPPCQPTEQPANVKKFGRQGQKSQFLLINLRKEVLHQDFFFRILRSPFRR